MRCSKCKAQLKNKTKFCPECGSKVKRHFLRKIILMMFILLIGSIGVLGQYLGVFRKNISSSVLAEANQKCIFVEESDINMQNESEGTAKVTVYIPNYEEIFKRANENRNPEQYLLDVLESGEYSQQKLEGIAQVTIEDGITVVHSDEIVEQIITDALIQAVHSLVEAKE